MNSEAELYLVGDLKCQYKLGFDILSIREPLYLVSFNINTHSFKGNCLVFKVAF